MEIKHCKLKTIYDCIYLTKENYKEVVKMVIKDNEGFEVSEEAFESAKILEYKDTKERILEIEYSEFRHSAWFFFDSWYVRPYDEYGKKGYWMNWPDEEFSQLYELVN